MQADALMEIGIVAKIALFLWFPLAIVFFTVQRPQLALLTTIVGGVMFLPERAELQIPGFVPLDKEEVCSLAALVGAMWRSRGLLLKAKPGRGADILILITFFAGIGTLIENSDPLPVNALQTLPGLTFKDLMSITAKDLLKVGVPFFLGRAMLQSSRDLRDLLKAFVIGGLIYAPLIPVEIRLSPQIHNWIYGFLPHYIQMALRSDGGWRPMLFMGGGGLGVAVFMAATVLAACGLLKARKPVFGLPMNGVSFFLWGILAITRSMAAIFYSTVLAPVILFFSPRAQTRFATIVTTVVLAYPVLRFTDVFPTDKLVDWAQSVSVTRAESLKFRFDQEKLLLVKAKEKTWFGWGGYSRNRAFDQWGRSTVTDGYWIIQFGSRGLFGFVMTFGILSIPIFAARRRIRKIQERSDRAMIAALSMMTLAYLVDLLPNGLFNELPFLCAGGLMGLSKALSKQPLAQPAVPIPSPMAYMPQPAPAPQVLFRGQGPRS